MPGTMPGFGQRLVEYIKCQQEQRIMRPFFEVQPLHFSCTGCGRCCETAGEYYVFLSRAESERIRTHLQLSVSWFRRRYLNRLDDGTLVLASTPDERCIFLAQDGKCTIYTVRPVQCRTYPFWPELAGNRRAWQQESNRCEGINQGDAIPVSAIRNAIRACQRASG
jgi:Fe-S-cluster containining protein